MSMTHTKSTTKSGVGVEIVETDYRDLELSPKTSVTITPKGGGESVILIFHDGALEIVSAPHTAEVDQTPGSELA